MKKRKILSAGLASILLFLTGNVFAADKVLLDEPVLSGKNVTISGQVSAPNEKIYIEVTRKDADILDKKNVYAAYQVTSNADGKFSYTYKMPELDRADSNKYSDGYFTAYAFSAGYDEGSIDFSYVSENGKKGFFKGLNESMKTKEKLSAFFASLDNKPAFESYGILIDEINSLEDIKVEINGLQETKKEKLCTLLTQSNLTFDEENISEINEFVFLMRLNAIKDKTEMKKLLISEEIASRCDLVYGAIDFDTLSPTLEDWVLKIFVLNSEQNGFDSFKEAEALFKEAVILNEINEAHYSDLYDILDKNKAELDIKDLESFVALEDLSENEQEALMQIIKEEETEIVSASRLKELIEEAYNSYSGSDSSGGSSSGSSSTSGKGSYIAGNISINTKGDTEAITPNPDKAYFNDLSNFGWAEQYINKLAANGIVSGNGNGGFEPERNVTRAEFLKMLLGALDLVKDEAVCEFDDVLTSDWSYKYVASAYAQGITSGIDDNTFGKDNLITRAEAAVFMHRSAIRAYIPMNQNAVGEFADSDMIASWAKRSVNVLYGAGLINGVGDNNFNPNGLTTRAQAAKMICSLFDLI